MAGGRKQRASYDGVVLTCPVTVPYSRYSIHAAHWWIGKALRALADSSGLSHRQFDGFCLSSFTAGTDSAIGIAQHMGLNLRTVDTIPLGGNSGVAAIRRAARFVQAGDADIVACVAADTNQIDTFRQTTANFSRFAQDAVLPYGSGGANSSFAMIQRNYMDRYGVTREDLGRIAVSQRANALKNPNALMKKPLTLDEYVNARAIASPVHLFDCVMPCAGAEAFLVMREDLAEELGLTPVFLKGAIERHNAIDDTVQEHGGWVVDIDELYETAGTTPQGIDVVQTYDDYPVIVMMQLEDLGFCKKGEGAAFVRSHDLTIGGDFPHNTSGGQLSAGQAGAAGGYIGLTESMRQVTGTAGPTQVAGAKTALASGFGMINYERGLASGAVILSGEGA
ncbi:thiolase family protein [Chachezhania sediminis]|uniref:thiolase family protein n=1 Tax=Chachezhania sediminis TaxID=2599291 RepID=UPI00131CB4E6|nr:thiolase family protein [Chachezhania sediminis]